MTLPYGPVVKYVRNSNSALGYNNRQLLNTAYRVLKNKVQKAASRSSALDSAIGHEGSSSRKRSRTGATVPKGRPVSNYVHSKRYSRVRYRKVKFRRVNNKKAGKLRRRLAGFVKDVVKCQENIGVYKRIISGDVSANLGTGSDVDASKVLWTGHNKVQQNGGDYTVEACKFTPMSAKRILDAASVLYNGKTAAVNYENGTGNFDAKVTKVEVMYSSYKLELTNHTFIPYWITCYEITPKENSQIDFVNTTQNIIAASTFDYSSNVGYFGIAPAFDNFGNKYKTAINLEWSDIKGLDKIYDIKKLSRKFIKPGKAFEYKTSAKDYCVEFSKMTYSSTDIQPGSSGPVSALATYPKGEKQLIFKAEPVTHLVKNSSRATAALSTHQAVFSVCWAVKTEEFFKIMQPRNTPVAYQGNKVKLFQGTAPPGSEDGTRESYGYGFIQDFNPALG